MQYVNYISVKVLLLSHLPPQKKEKEKETEGKKMPDAQQVTHLNKSKPFAVSQISLEKIGRASVFSFSSSSLHSPLLKLSALQKETPGLHLSQKYSPGPCPL